MQHVLTLVAGRLTEELVRAAAAELEPSTGAGEPRWLAPGAACDLPFADIDPEQVEDRVRGALAGVAVDLAAQPVAGRRKRLLVADMESTVVANEMLDELGDFAGKRRQIEEITARAMRGELDFDGSLRARVALLEGLGTGVLVRAARRIEIDPGAAALVATMSAGGGFCVLASGGFSIFTHTVAQQLGFDAWRANTLELRAGTLTGRVIEPILGRGAKAVALEDYCRELELTPTDAAAIGDGANDLGMLGAAGLGVAYHAKPAVAAAARYRVDHGDLRTLLYYQGYSEAEIVLPRA